MAYLGGAVLILSVSFLTYRQLDKKWTTRPKWLNSKSQVSKSSDGGKHVADAVEPKETPVLNVTDESVCEDDEQAEAEKTPKALTFPEKKDVPALSLDAPGEAITASALGDGPPIATKSSLSSQCVKQKTPPMTTSAQPSSRQPIQKDAALMPPPVRPASAYPSAQRSGMGSLRVPSTGPLPNRGPPTKSYSNSSATLAPNKVVATPNARNKVILAPGHSSMDWAALTRRGNLSGVGTFQRVTPSMLKTMTGRKGKPAWSSWQGNVYNITPYLSFHPGGVDELMKAAGRDGTKLFLEAHPWVNWENILGTCMVGVLVPENHGMVATEESFLESLD